MINAKTIDIITNTTEIVNDVQEKAKAVIEISIDKYNNFDIQEKHGTLLQFNVKTGIEYNEGEYTLTRYKVAGVAESQNSDVIRNDLTINGEQQNVASTDIIQIDNNSVADINIGLALLQNYDLKLDKYVSRIVMQNSKGTTKCRRGNRLC